MSQDQALIELASVSHGFGDQRLLDNFNLSLYQGDSLVLMGPSGGGKSVLLKMMAGLIRPQQGRVLYRGEDLSTLSKKSQQAHRTEVGMLFQQNALFDSMTVFDNLNFVLTELKGEDRSTARRDEIVELLKEVGLDHVLENRPGELSGGMQKRLGIARALVLKPKLVFYDDPTAGLDPITSRKIVNMILELKQRLGGTIVTVTNDVMRAYQLAGKCMICLPGEFILTGSAAQTRNFADPRVHQFIHGEVNGPLEGL